MHKAVKKFIKEARKEIPYKFRNRRILEVGSHNINGSVRKYFWFCKWTGVDISKGKNVDITGNYTNIKFDKKFQVVISTEMLEHDKDWKISLRKMYDDLEDNGLLIITCASNHRPEHGTKRTDTFSSPDTSDYYRNISKEDFLSVLPHDIFHLYILQYARGENDLQFYGIKKEFHVTSKDIYHALINGKGKSESI